MLAARPIQAFRLRGKQVVSCHVGDTNPNDFLDKELWFYSAGLRSGRIKIEGVSTASQPELGIFDFCYSGSEIQPEQLGETSLITEGRYDEVVRTSELPIGPA